MREHLELSRPYVQWPVYCGQCAVASVQCALCSVHFTVCTVKYVLYCVHCAVFSVQCALYKSVGTLCGAGFAAPVNNKSDKLLLSGRQSGPFKSRS